MSETMMMVRHKAEEIGIDLENLKDAPLNFKKFIKTVVIPTIASKTAHFNYLETILIL